MAKSPEEEHPQKAFGWAARDSSGVLSPFRFSRRHEIVGVVTNTGNNVEKFKVGDRVGVGVIVGSCMKCGICQEDLENYCPQAILTYNSHYHDRTKTYGGYSDMIVVHHRYVLRFPDNLPPDAGAPLLCAGITVYSPMKYYGMTEPGKHLGVAGLGGLGHIAVKIGKAFGLKVTVISSSPAKQDEAIKTLGADSFLLLSDPAKLKEAMGSMDYVVDSVCSSCPGSINRSTEAERKAGHRGFARQAPGVAYLPFSFGAEACGEVT